MRSYLEANGAFGKLLGPLLLAARDIDRGVVWAFAPDELPTERLTPLTDFEHGYVYPDPGRKSARRDSNDAWIREACNRVRGPWLLCVEHALAKPSDGWVARSDDAVFFCNDSVYLYETPETPSAGASKRLGGATWDPQVGIITEMPRSITNRQTFDEGALAALVAPGLGDRDRRLGRGGSHTLGATARLGPMISARTAPWPWQMGWRPYDRRSD